MKKLSFSISGEFITNAAREAFYQNHNLKRAIELVKSATMCDLSEGEHLQLCLDIISGKKSIVGTYPGDDYDVIENEEPKCTPILDVLLDREEKFTAAETNYNELLQKYLFVLDKLPEYKLREINDDYNSEYGELLFDIPQSKIAVYSSDISEETFDPVTDFINHSKTATNDDYGWLEPDGTYHPVPWGEHSKWAMDYANEHYPFKDNTSMYWKTDANGQRHHYVNGDFLVYALGWVLLDNPHQGTATPKYDHQRGLSKKQKEFLFDYYIARNMHDRASALYKDDDNF